MEKKWRHFTADTLDRWTTLVGTMTTYLRGRYLPTTPKQVVDCESDPIIQELRSLLTALGNETYIDPYLRTAIQLGWTIHIYVGESTFLSETVHTTFVGPKRTVRDYCRDIPQSIFCWVILLLPPRTDDGSVPLICSDYDCPGRVFVNQSPDINTQLHWKHLIAFSEQLRNAVKERQDE